MDAAEPPLVAVRSTLALRPKLSTKRRKALQLKSIQTTAAQGAGAKYDNTTRKVSGGSVSDAKETTPPKPSTRVMRKPSTTGRPIVPLTEQRSVSRTLSLARRDEEKDRWDVAPDGASAGREGRQFTVANVGNNGKLFLRPSVRRGNKRYPQPNFTFPITPPGTAGLEGVYPENSDEPLKAPANFHDNQFTPTPRTSTIPANYISDPSKAPSTSQHRRAVSDSTVRDFNSPTATDTEGYRIVITKPTHGDHHRPKTTDHRDDPDADGVPILNINIPSWKLGTPRFSTRGTPIFRGSSYAPTDDFRSNSRASMHHSSERSLGVPLRGLGSRRPSHLAIPQLRFPRTSLASSQASARPRRAVPSVYASHLVIEPDMFDDLTFKPACDDKLIVRYSPSGSVTAATPSRLVAEITSPSFLDYELISDFFLTYRAFLEPEILLRMLMARLRWALERTDEVGMIVRVRTFVAMRHWILNYFVDDFVLDYDLRVLFCVLLNDFVDELSQDAKERRVQLKILTELKKCWRRVCAHYWDGPEFDDGLGPQAPVAPGGIAGYRDPNLDPTFWDREGLDPPQWQAVSAMPNVLSDETNPSSDVLPTSTNIGHFALSEDRPGTPEHQMITNTVLGNGPASPLSIASMDIVSCSFPSKNVRSLNPNSSQPLAAHPVYSTSPILPPGAIATTPKALAGKRVRPAQSHSRNNSATDSLRGTSFDQSPSQYVDLHMVLQSAGNLVRGNILPPGQPFVDIEAETPTGDHRQTTIFQPTSRHGTKDRIFGVAMSGSGMKKFLGGVRRALNSRGQWSSGSHTSLPAVASLASHTISMDPLPASAFITRGAYAQSATRPLVRIDVLGAEVAEDFKRAIREEEEAAEAERLGLPKPSPTPSRTIPRPTEYSAAHMDSTTADYAPQERRSRPMSDMGITTGSQSIVIVDDTAPLDKSNMRDRLPAATFDPSVGGLSVGSFLTAGGDPTPPTTPPARLAAGTPRRSSSIFDQLAAPPSTSQDEPLPTLVSDMVALGDGSYGIGPSDDASRYSSSTLRRGSLRQPVPNRRTLRIQQRHQSINTRQSIYSFRRRASFGSRLERHSTARSFDATTDSSMLDGEYGTPAAEPLRMLRRRPGGYLRDAAGRLNNRPMLRKSHSVASFTTYTESIRSSYLLGTHAEQDDDDRSYVGVVEDRLSRDRHKIFSPIMRPSFEIEARKLAQIPDEDDGGIESALLKLEGKYQPKPKSLDQFRQTAMIDADEFGTTAGAADSYSNGIKSQWSEAGSMADDYRTQQTRGPSPQDKGKQPVSSAYSRDTMIARTEITNLETRSFLTADSDESYCSIPLLERGLTNDSQTRGVDAQSFLEDASVGGSDLSSELSPSEDESVHNTSGRAAAFSMSSQPHPFGDPLGTPRSNSSSAPMTLAQALAMSPVMMSPVTMSPVMSNLERTLHPDQIWSQKPLPLSPEIFHGTSHNPDHDPPHNTEAPVQQASEEETPKTLKYSVHLPFILAFPSDILAQQFTLIEKDALNDIDWRELIEMNWRNATSNDSRSWVDFLRNTNAHGVEVVVARFNIMVKWAISEIVLTQHIEERARCIIKLIHIAAHCRRYRNFATLAQLTIALSSAEVARLSKTWELVPARDLNTLGELEALVTPTRNFYNLRAEMEVGSDGGCIPFVGIYTHDLLFNAQRASEIASSPTTPPLINFERCRIAASVIKTLLRLLEASTRYTFQPVEGITERCLWMGALSDDEIRRHSEALE
ncbi:guanine nucleotide exchange factor-like protein [Trichoderma citrinoviride]|uniref:Guanine nucleotide exchange factor-like protein n=1 Tax=Trichoderma citrinoviride TaxID=58853 RepID=A0A2T4BAP7_9HYPO|nr:guanine nucleotide exchange factor-like protein [Trichoderma citrinoviride]PTB66400.1 guanine nucleotide exchange factor-like protein [Trichoderma citrinoviride]